MNRGDRIHLAVRRGLLGSTLVRRMHAGLHEDLLLRTRQELNPSSKQTA